MNNIIQTAHKCIACGASGQTLKTKPAFLMPFVANRVFGWEPFKIEKSFGYKDVKPGWAYPLCNSVACTNCGLIFSDIRFTDEQMSALYEGYRGHEYVIQRKKFERNYNEQEKTPLNYIVVKENFIKKSLSSESPLAILDWGGDTGQSVVFNDGVNDVFSYDVGRPRPLQNNVKRFDIGSDKKFDLITCSHVLEHVPYPINFVAELKKFLKTDGVIFFELPMERIMDPSKNSTIEEQLSAKHHWHEHINFFSINSLEHVFSNSGFDILDFSLVKVDAPGNFDSVVMANLCKSATRCN